MAIIQELVRKNRSYRRFDQTHLIDTATLHALVDAGRLSPNGANLQTLRYAVSNGATNNLVFPTLGWAGYLKDWDGPAEGERPTGYIIMLCDSASAKNPLEDAGIAAQSIMLGAVEQGLGGCIFNNICPEQHTAICLKNCIEVCPEKTKKFSRPHAVRNKLTYTYRALFYTNN